MPPRKLTKADIRELTYLHHAMDAVTQGLALLLFAYSAAAWATHNRAGEIVYCVDPNNPLLYHVQIITHTKTTAPADRPELYINWGDGTGDTLPRTDITTLPPLDAQRNLYDGSHLYSGSGEFILSFEDQNRNEGVLNIPNSVNQTFCVKTMLKIGAAAAGSTALAYAGLRALERTAGNAPTALAARPKALSMEKLKGFCLLYTSPSPRDRTRYRMPSSA